MHKLLYHIDMYIYIYNLIIKLYIVKLLIYYNLYNDNNFINYLYILI